MRHLIALLALTASAATLAQTPAQPAASAPAAPPAPTSAPPAGSASNPRPAASGPAPTASGAVPTASGATPAASGPAPAASRPTPAASGAGRAATSRPAKEPPPPPQSALTGPLMYQLLVSELSFRQGTPESVRSGFQIMLDAARRTGDAQLFKRATEMALQAHSGPDALQATRAWRTALPQSPDANRYELQVLIALDRAGETADPLRRTLETLPRADREDFIVALPTLYARTTDKALAQRIVERVLSAGPVKSPELAPAAWASIGQMRLDAGNPAGALDAATVGATSGAPSSTPGSATSPWPALLALQLMAGAPTPEAKATAEALVKNYLKTPAAKPEVQLGYARTLADAGRPQDALAQLVQLTQRQPDFSDGWLALGSMRASQGQTNEAQTALTRYLDIAAKPLPKQPGAGKPNPLVAQQRIADMDTARLLLAQLAEKRGDTKAANQWLAAVQSPDQMLAVALQRATLLANQGRTDEGLALIRSVPDRGPDDAMLKLRAQAQLLRDHQRPADAYKLLNDALTDAPDDQDLIYDTAMAAAKADRVDDETRLLRRLIALSPQSPTAYNALGYDLADRGLRLDEARQLVEKAAALAPNDAFIRDSLGWVQFRLGNLQDARRLLESAFKQQPDAEIAAHLGEVLWAQGERDAARTIWRQGLALDAKNDTLQKTLTRLKAPRP